MQSIVQIGVCVHLEVCSNVHRGPWLFSSSFFLFSIVPWKQSSKAPSYEYTKICIQRNGNLENRIHNAICTAYISNWHSNMECLMDKDWNTLEKVVILKDYVTDVITFNIIFTVFWIASLIIQGDTWWQKATSIQ